ncbi:MAG: hypothetical protein OXC95_06455 [Dehalococcoidia bacterium]|nr:hypothetical protein [Dehalococcoidia bacterium]
MNLVKLTIWLMAVLIGLFLLYVAVVSGTVMIVGIFTGSGELTGSGFAGLVCTAVLIVAPAVWYLSRRKKRRAVEDESMQF